MSGAIANLGRLLGDRQTADDREASHSRDDL
jgi:hypothetical protein